MRKKRYERTTLLFTGVFIFFFIELLFLVYLLNKKVQVYQTIQGVVSNNSIVLFLTKEERDKIYANTFLYVDGKNEEYKILNDLGVVLEDKDKSYYQIELSISSIDHYKNNDSITMSIKDKKIKMIEIFHIILEGD